nr:LytR C-terminal domain-containing protein [Blastococcus saxobsidens]
MPPLIFLLVLALAAGAVWWTVVRQDREREADQAQACASAEAAPPSLEPGSVLVRVFNATDSSGLAGQVADQLRERGLTVTEVANDSGQREVEGVGEVRFGKRGSDQARYMSVYLPGATEYQDTRSTAEVDLVLGPEFPGLASVEDVEAALTAVEDAPTGC